MKHYESGFGLRSLLRSFKNAYRGIHVLARAEYNLYIQIICAILVTILGVYFNISFIEWALQFVVIGLVIFSELINTAVEKIMDFVHSEYSDKVKDIKDLSAGAVLFTVLISLVVAFCIYFPKIFLS